MTGVRTFKGITLRGEYGRSSGVCEGLGPRPEARGEGLSQPHPVAVGPALRTAVQKPRCCVWKWEKRAQELRWREPGQSCFCSLPDPMKGAESDLVTHKPQDEYPGRMGHLGRCSLPPASLQVRAEGQGDRLLQLSNQSLISRYQGHSKRNTNLCFS